MTEVLVRRRPSSPAPAAPPDDDDLLWEILLRLPPLPSSLPRASLVCKRWRRLVSDPGFLRRFRAHHHRKAPLLVFFCRDSGGELYFTPTLDPPDCIPAARFSLPRRPGDSCSFLGCRHGLALFLNRTRREAVVWNPVTGDQRCVPYPPGIGNVLHGGVVCAAGNDDVQLSLRPFKLVLLCANHGPGSLFAYLYRSEYGLWDDMIPTPVDNHGTPFFGGILVGNTLFWWLLRGYILEFDLDKQSAAVIKRPVDATSIYCFHFQILRTEDNRLGFAVVSQPCKIR